MRALGLVGYRWALSRTSSLCGVTQECIYETINHNINNLQKCLMQTCFDFDRNIIDAGVTI